MSEKEQNNTMLYIVVFISLIIIGVVKAVFGSLFSTAEVDLVPVIVTEVIGAALMGGLFVYIIQRITAPAQRLNDKFEIFSQEQARLSDVQEKIIKATGTYPAITVEKTQSTARAKATSAPATTSAPQPVAATPAPPPEPAKDSLEAQLEQELEAVHFDDMFADYKAERDAARARGENIDDEGGNTFVSDSK